MQTKAKPKTYEGYNVNLSPRIMRIQCASPSQARKLLALQGYALCSRTVRMPIGRTGSGR
jgi:hypothetical protein